MFYLVRIYFKDGHVQDNPHQASLEWIKSYYHYYFANRPDIANIRVYQKVFDFKVDDPSVFDDMISK